MSDFAYCKNCNKKILSGIPFCPHCGSKQTQVKVGSEYDKDPYDILQVSKSAEPEVIEAAYKGLSKKYHPDTNPSPEAEEKMREINWAHDILSKSEKTEEYSEQIKRKSSQEEYRKEENIETPKETVPDQQPQQKTPTAQSAQRELTPDQIQTKRKSNKRDIDCLTVSMIGGVLFILIYIIALLTSINSSVPTSTITKTSKPDQLIIKTPTIIIYKTKIQAPTSTLDPTDIYFDYLMNNCIMWDEVTVNDVGKEMCVYGRVKSIDANKTIYFSSYNEGLRIRSEQKYFPDIKQGDCVVFIGRIHRGSKGLYPWMVIGEIEGYIVNEQIPEYKRKCNTIPTIP